METKFRTSVLESIELILQLRNLIRKTLNFFSSHWSVINIAFFSHLLFFFACFKHYYCKLYIKQLYCTYCVHGWLFFLSHFILIFSTFMFIVYYAMSNSLTVETYTLRWIWFWFYCDQMIALEMILTLLTKLHIIGSLILLLFFEKTDDSELRPILPFFRAQFVKS